MVAFALTTVEELEGDEPKSYDEAVKNKNLKIRLQP